MNQTGDVMSIMSIDLFSVGLRSIINAWISTKF